MHFQMSNTIFTLSALLSAALMQTACVASNDVIREATFARTDFCIRDPFVLAENGVYYLYESKPWDGGCGVFVRRSSDLEHWTDKRQVMRVADEFSRLATAIGQAKKDGLKVGVRGLTALSLKLGAGLDDLHFKCDRLEKSLGKADSAAQIAAMEDLRKTVDRLEGLVDDAHWPLPKYREMLFVH